MATIYIGPKILMENIKPQLQEVADNSLELLKNRVLELEHELSNQIPKIVEFTKFVEVFIEKPFEVIKEVPVEIPVEVVREVKIIEEKFIDVIKEIDKEIAVFPFWAKIVMAIQFLLIIFLIIF